MAGELELTIKLEGDVRDLDNKLKRLAENFSRLIGGGLKGALEDFERRAREFAKVMSEDIKNTIKIQEQYMEQGYDNLVKYYAKSIDEKLKDRFGRWRYLGYALGSFAELFGMEEGVLGEWAEVSRAVRGGRGSLPMGLGKLLGLGAVIVAILGAILDKVTKILYEASAFSGYGKATLRLLSTMFKLALKPIADAIGMILLPILVWFLKNVLMPFIKSWNELIKQKGAKEMAGLGMVGGALVGGAVLGPIGIMLGAVAGVLVSLILNWVKEKVVGLAKDIMEKKSLGYIEEARLKLKGSFLKVTGYVYIALDKLFLVLDEFFLWIAEKIIAVAEKIAGFLHKTGLQKSLRELKESINRIREKGGLEAWGEYWKSIGELYEALADLSQKIKEEGYTDIGEFLKKRFGEDSRIYDIWRQAGENLEKFAEKLIEFGFKDEDLKNIRAFIDKIKELGLNKEYLEETKKKMIEYWEKVEQYYANQGLIYDELVETSRKSVAVIRVKMQAVEEAYLTMLNELGDLAKKIVRKARSIFTYSGVSPEEWTPTNVEGLYARQTGGIIPETGLYLMHRGEFVIPVWHVSEVVNSLRQLREMRNIGDRGNIERERRVQIFDGSKFVEVVKGMLGDIWNAIQMIVNVRPGKESFVVQPVVNVPVLVEVAERVVERPLIEYVGGREISESVKGGEISIGSINVTVNVDRIDSEFDLDRLAEEIGIRIMRNISRYGGV